MTEETDTGQDDADPFEDMDQADIPAEGDPFSELAKDYGDRVKADADFTQDDPFIDSSPGMRTTEETDEQDASADERLFQPETPELAEPSSVEDTDLFMDSVSRSGDPFESADGLFTSPDIETIDPDSVWQELTSRQSDDSKRERVRTYADVSKHAFCEQCEYFSNPPAVSCTHEGTDIVEFRDMETVRLIDCPVVAERKELEAETASKYAGTGN